MAQLPGQQLPLPFRSFSVADVDAVLRDSAIIEFPSGKEHPAARTIFTQILFLVRPEMTRRLQFVQLLFTDGDPLGRRHLAPIQLTGVDFGSRLTCHLQEPCWYRSP